MTGEDDDTHHQSSNTQVSLVPPPWLEFTTSDPLRIATRVSPPGVILIPCGDISTKGRRSTCRGASPALVKIGTVDSDSVGCEDRTSVELGKGVSVRVVIGGCRFRKKKIKNNPKTL